MEYSFAQGDDGPVLGLHRAGRWDEVLEIDSCHLTSDVGNAIRNRIRDWAREERLPPYDQGTQEGYLRHLVVREGRNTGQALVQLVTDARRAVRPRAADRSADGDSRRSLDPLVREPGSLRR